jgi:hypothetical protein
MVININCIMLLNMIMNFTLSADEKKSDKLISELKKYTIKYCILNITNELIKSKSDGNKLLLNLIECMNEALKKNGLTLYSSRHK